MKVTNGSGKVQPLRYEFAKQMGHARVKWVRRAFKNVGILKARQVGRFIDE